MTQTTFKELIEKMKEGKKFYGLFHNDLDGYGCGKVASTYINLVDAKYILYNKINSEIEKYCNETYKEYEGLIVADLNLDLSNIEKLNKLAKSGHLIIYFDHHFKSNEIFDFFKKKSKIIFDYDKDFCATSIMLKHFIKYEYNTNVNIERLTDVVNLIDAWDMYKWQDPETFEVVNDNARDLSIYFKEFGSEKTLEKIDNYVTGKFENIFSNMEISNIKLLKRILNKAIKDRNKNLVVIQYPFNEEILNIGITYADKDISEIGNRLNILNRNLDFIVIIDMIHNSVNFRTIFDKPNLANVAALYGGGGHPKAAGCELNEKAFNAFVNKSLSREQINVLLSCNFNKKSNENMDEEVENSEE